jgi:hypothetical protein
MIRSVLLALTLCACDGASMIDAGVDAGPRVDAGGDAGPPGVDASFVRLTGGAPHPLDSTLRLGHLQAEGTHNSYHLRPEHVIADWDYEHAPLFEQLESQGVRALELDFSWDEELQRFRVFHVPLLDERTSCDLLLECLAELRRWSDAHPGHHPLFVQLEPKDQRGLSAAEIGDRLDREIRAVFTDELIVTPDLVQGSAATLAAAIVDPGWPLLADVRGRTLFFLDCSREFCVEYANDGAGLAGRAAFVASEPGDPFAAIRVMNTPGDDVRAAVEAGYIVRTRAISMPDALEADLATLQAELDLALASGAHIISTDVPVARADVALHVEIPGGTPSRCNPITAPAECTSLAIEDPVLITP